MPRYLVTGGAGFIGSNLSETLLRKGEFVRILDNFSTGKRENIEEFVKDVDLIEGDLRNYDDVKKAVEGIDFILHQGAIPSVQRSIDQPRMTNEVNITGTLNLLIASREARVKRFIYASSSSVYGDSPTLPKQESMQPNPLSPYAFQKWAGEHYCRLFQLLYGLETICLRYFNVFGPRQDAASEYSAVIPRFITALASNQQPTIYGDGLQSRDFTFVSDVVDANLLACTAPKEATGKIYNVACNKRHNLLELIDELKKIMDKNSEPRFDPPRPGEVKHSQGDIGEAEKSFSYHPRVSFTEGLTKTVEWFS